MKANQVPLPRGDGAVSPVIAVILMVAITVVLAATVYIWVTGFSTSGEQAPPVGMRTETQKTNEWKVRVSSMSQGARAMTEFRFSLITPTNGTFVANATTFDTFGANATGKTATSVSVMATPYTATAAGAAASCCWQWQIQFVDADANAAFSTGDRVIVTFDDNDDDTGSEVFDDTIPLGKYTFEVIHIQSGELSGFVSATYA